MDLKEQIKGEIEETPIILYMKGTKEMPMCGFSNAVVQALNTYGIEYKDVNVLEDPEIRVKLSELSNWPTIPQLFVKGQLIGGCDITLELHQNGELANILGKVEVVQKNTQYDL
ncbi:MAG: Grx4 family monothiol glutaredoxin [Candidatus Marinimicrobia bacterium]|nr:Grx4 family monothiol glutaredoxin [Candidatus Neomarinimicrobiota bacterium]